MLRWDGKPGVKKKSPRETDLSLKGDLEPEKVSDAASNGIECSPQKMVGVGMGSWGGMGQKWDQRIVPYVQSQSARNKESPV